MNDARRSLASAACALMFVIASGCGGLSQLPADGGPEWVELESEHFVLQTDLPPQRARETLEQAERLFMGLLHVGWPTEGVIHLRLNLVVFADRDDFHHFGGDDVGGYFVREALLEPLVVMPAPGRFDESGTLAHELTHYISAQSLQNQPAWLAEGLATYYETARFDSNGDFVIGGVPRGLFAALRHFGRMPSAQLMAADTDPQGSWRFYPSAWIATHYLMSRRQEALAAYMQALGSGMDHDAAWRSAFGSFDHAALDAQLRAYEIDRRYDNFVLRGPASVAVGAPRALGNADVAALRGLLHATCKACDAGKQRALADVERALREQPRHLRASAVKLMHLSASGGIPDVEPARVLAQEHPDAWLPAVALALAQLQARAEPRAAQASAARALELAPYQPYALMLAAVFHAQLGERDLALSRADFASRLQPTNPRLLALQLPVLDALGECEQLAAAVQRLGSVLHGRIADAERASLQGLVAECTQRRAERPAPGAVAAE